MGVGGVDHIEISPDERTVGRCDWNLWILTLVQMFMSIGVASMQMITRASSTTERKTQKNSGRQNHNHTERGSACLSGKPVESKSAFLKRGSESEALQVEA
jgi:hypothetical protein